jgi:sulfur-oxidizing protein SoxX
MQLVLLLALPVANATAADLASEGRALFTDPRRGNCSACHQLPNDPAVKSSSTFGPVLSGVKARFPDRATLRALIWDSSSSLPGSSMPPYGKHHLLSETEIDKLVGYLESL